MRDTRGIFSHDNGSICSYWGCTLGARGPQVAFLNPHSTGELMDPGTCGGLQHLCKVTQQHHLHLRWDMSKNTACDRACKRGLWEVKLTTQGLDQNPEGLKALKSVISLAASLSPDWIQRPVLCLEVLRGKDKSLAERQQSLHSI